MSKSLRQQLLQLFPQEVAEVSYGRQKWKVIKKTHPTKPGAFNVHIHYWDRRNNVFYRVWYGTYLERVLKGRFQIAKHPKNFDYTPVRRDHVYQLATFIGEVFKSQEEK